ncbi:MAG: ECF transporter S component [Bacteroides sp.]|nr:ECF transporter S component [Bacteroides sp.]MCM1549459.1 ECF transporter S component [Clostridium sp.]
MSDKSIAKKRINKEADTRRGKENIKVITITGLFIALTLIFTACVNVKLPFGYGGLIHLGNIPLFLAAMLYGKRTGFLAGAFGMAIFDIMSSWTIYAPCTFLTCGLMGLVVGLIVEKKKAFGWKIVAVVAALVIKLAGYYIFEAIFYHSFVEPLASFPGNTLQIILAAIPALILVVPLEKILNKAGLLFTVPSVKKTEASL